MHDPQDSICFLIRIQMSRTKRFIEVKDDRLFLSSMALMPFIDVNDAAVAVFVDEGRNPAYCYHLLYSSTGSSQQLFLTNILTETYTIDLGMFPLEILQGSIVRVGGISKHCFEGMLRRDGIAIPWISRNDAAISGSGPKSQKQRSCKKEKRCYLCQSKKSECAELRLCSGCEQVRYCSRQCQKVSWKNQHRYECEFI